jgi:hypothetical protein
MFLHCCSLDADRRVLKESRSLLPVKGQGVFLETECELDALNSTDLRGKRPLTVGECLL